MERGNPLSDPEISSENEKVISDDSEDGETFNNFFVSIVSSPKILPKENYETDIGNDTEFINYINEFKSRPNFEKKSDPLALIRIPPFINFIHFLLRKFFIFAKL